MDARAPSFLFKVAVAIPLVIGSCFSAHSGPSVTSETPQPATTPTSTWSDLLQRTPYPYTTPLPPAQATILDGTYTKFNPTQSTGTPLPEGGVWMPHPVRKGARWLKPLPYPLAGGAWNLMLDKGVFRVFHETTGWRTLGSFTVSDDRIKFFNDPHCINAVGIYQWKLEEDRLILQVIEDECDGRVLGGGGLRVTNFSSQPWTLDNTRADD
jgi:hypothetical protein